MDTDVLATECAVPPGTAHLLPHVEVALGIYGQDGSLELSILRNIPKSKSFTVSSEKGEIHKSRLGA